MERSPRLELSWCLVTQSTKLRYEINNICDIIYYNFTPDFFFKREIIYYHSLSIFCLKVCDRTSAPQWNEGFYFKVHNPKEEMLIIKVNVLNLLQYNTQYSTIAFKVCCCPLHFKC